MTMTMERFARNDERLTAYVGALWNALVPSSGECASVQGELVRVQGRLSNEHYRNGTGNYYTPYEDHHGFADGVYPQMLVFLCTTLVANANDANDAATVAYFADVLANAPADWNVQQKIDAIGHREHDEDRELTDEENAEIDALDATPGRLHWEELLDRAEIAVANYCLANPVLVDRKGAPAVDGGVKDVRHVFDPPPPPPKCALCNGRGWLPPQSASDFPTVCSCKTAAEAN